MANVHGSEDIIEGNNINCYQTEKVITFAETDLGDNSCKLVKNLNDAPNDENIPKRWYRFSGTRRKLLRRANWHGPEVSKRKKSIVRQIEKCLEGYSRLGALIDSDENFQLYRRFGYLQARVMLYKQDQLRELEERLDLMDEAHKELCPRKLKQRDMEPSNDCPRKDLMLCIEQSFKEYAQLLVLGRDLATFNPPPACDYTSVRDYFDKEAPVVREEQYIKHIEDIVTLKPGREHSWLDSFIEGVVVELTSRFKFMRYIFLSSERREKADPTSIRLFSRDRVNIAVSLIITLTIVALLIIPIYVLWKLTNGEQTQKKSSLIIGILLIFTLVFSGVLSLFTRAKRHEILAAAAAYCAVLVVFIGNVPGDDKKP
ncbi:hypothetical protein B0J14DRAFT_703559 [Halenospora varia]|nr:hypothetical protein B0J14DRAFT_703559 [Halenospora varia]